MKTIIVPTDFSSSSTNAMNYALDMAIALKAEVILFHVYSVPISVSDVPVMLVSVEELEKNAQSQMVTLKRNAEHISPAGTVIKTETRLGDTIDELENLCEEIQPFAVVMGTRETSGIERSLFGSTTMSVVHRLKWPIIAVPPGKEYGTGIKKIGFACDLKDVVDTTPGGMIKDIVNQFGASLFVMNVNNISTDDIHLLENSGEFVLLKTMLAELNPVYSFIKNEDVDEAINAFAETNNIDLIITIPKKHQLLDGLFKKRSTKKLVFHSHVPVMCIHE